MYYRNSSKAIKNSCIEIFINDELVTILILMSLGKQIRKARRMANMTQQDLATKVGIVLSSIFNIERGKTDPRWSTVQKIANILNIPLDKIRKSK